MSAKTGGKRVYFEVMRVIACFLVVFGHSPGLMLYAQSEGIKQVIYMFIAMVTCTCVPLFFLVSGALLFKKDEDFMRVFKKRVSKIAALILIFDIVLILTRYFIVLRKGEEFGYTIKDFVLWILSNEGPYFTAYWFLYAYLGMLLILPFLQRIAKGLTKAEFIAIIALRFLTSTIIPIANLILQVNGSDTVIKLSPDFDVPFAFARVFFYTMIGFYLEYNIDIEKIKGKHIAILSLSAVAGIIVAMACIYARAPLIGEWQHNDSTVSDYYSTMVLFILIKYFYTVWSKKADEKKRERFDNFICFVSSKTLGIYMLAPIFYAVLAKPYFGYFDERLPLIISSIIWTVLCLALGSAITFVLQKVPGLKKIL
ncbi:MAG: acyltransferase [Lachnospiraceae bacterium]|nr:acyltransferase [Lachnospiraceae bacterium]